MSCSGCSHAFSRTPSVSRRTGLSPGVWTCILFVIFGAIWTRNRPYLAAMHIDSLVWGVIVEVSPVSCPLTWPEELGQAHPYRGGFLAHYVSRVAHLCMPLMLPSR